MRDFVTFNNQISIQVKNVSFRYPRSEDIVKNFSAEMHSGTAYFLRGPNGAGKTTLFKIIAGCLKPSSGEVLIGGESPNSDIAKQVFAYLPQFAYAPMYMKVETFVTYYCAYFDISEEYARENLKEFDLSKRVLSLSGGWQQRLKLRMAMLSGRQILIFDEPTAGVDVDAQKVLWDELVSFVQRGGLLCWADHFDPNDLIAGRVPMEEFNVTAAV